MSEGESYQKDATNGATYQEIPGSAAGRAVGYRKWMIGGAIFVVLALVYVGTMPEATKAPETINKTLAASLDTDPSTGKLKLFDELNRYVLEDFDVKSTWSSFLPDLAGYYGKPVWVFYVNRGQGVATFGTESKEYPILEFNAANKAYQLTPWVGFRTFIRGERGGKTFNVEPFSPKTARNLEDPDDDPSKPKRILFVGTNELEIRDIDGQNGLETMVQYYVLPEEDFASLVRRSSFTNLGQTDVTLDILDGLVKMEPFGGPMDWSLKNMGRTIEGWMGVYHADATLTLPFFKLSTESNDSAEVVIEEAGHYCIAFIENKMDKATLLPVVFDTDKIFGGDTSLQNTQGLDSSSVEEILANPQYGYAKTSSSFPALTKYTLKPGETVTIASVYGKADHIEKVPQYADTVTAPGYIEAKFERARQITAELTAGVKCNTVSHLFDGTVAQMFLDNSLRGGFPTILGDVESGLNYDENPGVKVFHSFSRIHGDLERDYNAFKIEPTFFSQGPGNYRDIAQNRRNDVAFAPRMGSFDIQMFLGFIQSDAYEPLTVEAVVYRFTDPTVAAQVATEVTADEQSAKTLAAVFTGGPFRPGQLFSLCEQLGVAKSTSISNDVFINTILANAEDRSMAVYGDGFWADHWDYYLDMIEAYLAVYPDGEEAVMYDNMLRYFFSTASVNPRSAKYVLTLTYDGQGHHVQQLEATYWDQEKVDEQAASVNANTGLMSIEANWQRTAEGQPFMSTPIAKLFLLGAIKFATRDAYGMGIEYEAGRPGWLDAMNGLPGMVGSGMPETYELYLLLQYIQKVVDKYQRHVVVPVELAKLVGTINDALATYKSTGYEDPEDLLLDVPQPMFEYWDTVATARETYRNETHLYFSGETVSLKASAVSAMISTWLDEMDLGIARTFKFGTQGFGDDGHSGIPPTYFSFDITDWVENGGHDGKGLPTVDAKAMRVRKFPLFLEGPVRYMKYVINDKDRIKDVYDRVMTSGLRDTILNMYFLSSSLKGQGFDMGRQVAFAPGWLENQSIWMHMSYKYYLQMLRGKLYDEFFAEYKGGALLPFMEPEVYGRSLMEASSFMASSAFPDPSIVGEGYLPRLSGTTAEFMDIWKHMFIGSQLFFLNSDGVVEMQLVPALPDWLFEDESSGSEPTLDSDGHHTVSFNLFSKIPVIYHNPGGGNLYGVPPKKYNVTLNTGEIKEIDGPTIPTDVAIAVRRVKTVASIDVYF